MRCSLMAHGGGWTLVPFPKIMCSDTTDILTNALRWARFVCLFVCLAEVERASSERIRTVV